MKRNRLFILGIVTVLVALLSLTLVSGTFAKYTSSATGSDTARVAKWQVKLNNVDVTNHAATPKAVEFNLFQTINEADTTSSEADVKAGKIIAPGTGGSFALVLENKSEVTAKYAIEFETTNAGNIPVEFSLTKEDGSWKSAIDDLNIDADDTETKLVMESGTATVNVYWRWAYEGSGSENFTTSQTDVTDTTLGQAGTAELTVKATVIFTQVD